MTRTPVLAAQPVMHAVRFGALGERFIEPPSPLLKGHSLNGTAHPGQTRPTVVIADDDATLCDFIAMALGELGYETQTAANGAEALELVERELPALVLMDIGMPILSGRNLAERIQEVSGRCVPCVLMSGDLPAPDESGEDVIAGYLSKPFDLDTLIAVVRRCTSEPAPA